MFRMIKRSPWIILGAATAWFLDPNAGPERRAQTRRKLDEVFGAGDVPALTPSPASP